MPRGRKPNYDKQIAELIAALKKALVAREQARIESAVGQQVASLIRAFGDGSRELSGLFKGVTVEVDPTSQPKQKQKRKPRSASSRALQARKMRAYWVAKKAMEAKKAPATRAGKHGSAVK